MDESQSLSGLRVLDLSRVLAGPSCTQILSDLGAEVIKVERPFIGDDTRGWGPPWLKQQGSSTLNASTYFASTNRGKKSIAIDISKDSGRDLVHKLAIKSDIFVENFKVGDLKRYGLDYKSIQKINPKIIYCSITGYGQDGSSSSKPGYDYVFQAIGGLMSVTGEDESLLGSEPQRVGVPIVDIALGLYSSIAILSAIYERHSSGIGQHIDMALLDTVVALGGNQATGFLNTGNIPKRQGNGHPSLVPYQVFTTQDGKIVVSVGNDDQWIRFCKSIERLDLELDDKWQKSTQRVEGRVDLINILNPIMKTKSSQEWIEQIEKFGVPCGRINNYQEVFDMPEVQHRGLIIEQMDTQYGPVKTVANPIKMSRSKILYERPPPQLGQHTECVLKELLNLGDDELFTLKKDGVI